MNKFISSIVAGKSVLSSRASQLESLVKNSVEKNRIKINSKIAELNMERTLLLDFAPESTDSLRPGNGRKFDSSYSDEWAEKLLKIDCDLYDLLIQKDIIEKETEELFGEIDEPENASDDDGKC